MKVLTAALFGVIFGLGLLISGMLDPDKVLGFLAQRVAHLTHRLGHGFRVKGFQSHDFFIFLN